MNNQEPQNQIKTTEEAVVNNRRRFIKGASIATPVILTLSSSSAFGAPGLNHVLCLSQQLSGNASGNPGSCVTGNTPAYWANPANKSAWPSGATSYGTLPVQVPALDDLCANYTGGIVFNAATVFNTGSSLPLREILCASLLLSSPSPDAIWATAWLNSKTIPNYVLDNADVLGLKNGTIVPPPPFTDPLVFLQSTWS